MSDRIAVKAAEAGAQGASYRKLLTYSGKVAGDYVLNETNFAGLGVFLPCTAMIAVTPGGGGAEIDVSYNAGTNWLRLVGGTTPFGRYLHLDSATTLRVTITTDPADVRIFVQ